MTNISRANGNGQRPPVWRWPLKDTRHNLTCRSVPVDRAHAATVDRLKKHIVTSFARQGYEGFSREIDAYHDPFSTYFYVENHRGELLAVLRLTGKTDYNLLSLEQGIFQDGGSYRLAEAFKIADVNSFVFSSSRALPLIFPAVAGFAIGQGMEKGFCLLDVGSARFRRIYLRAGYRYSTRYAEPIYFPTFGKTVHGTFRPTFWAVMEIDHESILRQSRNAQNYQRLSPNL